jgi:hypothetical protein
VEEEGEEEEEGVEEGEEEGERDEEITYAWMGKVGAGREGNAAWDGLNGFTVAEEENAFVIDSALAGTGLL